MYINTYNSLYKYDGLRNGRFQKPELTRDWLTGNKFKYGLIGHYKSIGNVSALGTWYDISGNDNNATLVGDAYIDSNGINLDGTGDYALTGTTFIDGSNSRTISTWIYYTGDNGDICGWGTDATGQRFALKVETGVLFGWGYAADLYASTSLVSSNWYMATLVYDGTNRHIYLNDLLDGSDTPSLNTGTTYNAAIGAEAGSFANGFIGIIDDVRIYNRALSQQEIQELYLKTKRP